MNPVFLRRDVMDVQPWAETCGQIRPLVEEKDVAAAEVHHLQITDSKLHYHERTDEIYYVLEGDGRMRLNEEEIELFPGLSHGQMTALDSPVGKPQQPQHSRPMCSKRDSDVASIDGLGCGRKISLAGRHRSTTSTRGTTRLCATRLPRRSRSASR